MHTQNCLHCQSSFAITQGDMNFYAKISPIFAGKKFAIPTPTLCPSCRQRRRLAFRNERNLYRRTCDASGKQIISIYSPDKPYKVYDQKIRWSDSRDPMDYGRDFDFSKTFTENFGELMKDVPRVAVLQRNSENSEYTNLCEQNKNCYMIIESSNNESCMYSNRLQECNYCVDCSYCNTSEVCYGSQNLQECYNLTYSQDCEGCVDSQYLRNCKGCSFCFACEGLENKKYYIFNISYNSKAEYESKLKQISPDEIEDFYHTHQNEYQSIIQSENCTGSYIIRSKDCQGVHHCHDSENCKYTVHTRRQSVHNMDCDTSGMVAERNYETINTAINSYKNISCIRCRGVSECYYCDNCDYSHNLFGCIGLRHKQYCIFNKQYTKAGYEERVARIIGHMQETAEWGEFFHPSLSPFGYNETVAQEYYPLSSPLPTGQAGSIPLPVPGVSPDGEGGQQPFSPSLKGEGLGMRLGYKRSNYEAPKPVSDKVIQGKDLPRTIDEIQDEILQYAVACEVTGRLFRIQPQELIFYRKHHIPLPRKHPDQRHLERLQMRR